MALIPPESVALWRVPVARERRVAVPFTVHPTTRPPAPAVCIDRGRLTRLRQNRNLYCCGTGVFTERFETFIDQVV